MKCRTLLFCLFDLGKRREVRKTGNFLSGGRNRKHDYTGRYKRIDSYEFGKCFPVIERKDLVPFKHTGTWTDGSSIGFIIHNGHIDVGYAIESGGEHVQVRETLYFEAVPNNYGGADRYYFTCPYCGRRARYLYLHRRHFKCRKCADLNYYRQQLNNSNEDITVYKMQKLLRDKFKIKDKLSPWDAARYRPERPKGMHEKTYRRLRIQLLRLQEEYTGHLWAFVGRLRGER